MTEAHPSPPLLKPSHIAGYVVICLIWGSTWLAIRVTVHDIPPFAASGIRFLLAGIVLLSLARGQRRQWPQGEDQWKAILVLSLTMMAIPFGLVFWAEQYVFSSMAAILYSASPLVISLFTSIFMHQKVPRRAVLAMVVAFGGIVALLYTEPSTSRRALLGYGALLLGMTLSAWSAVYAKERLHHVDPVISTGLQLFLGSIALGWATWALESHRHAAWTRSAVIALAFLTVVGSCVAFVVYYWLLKHMQPYQLGTANLVIPVIAVLEGWLRGEAMRWMMMLVIVLILVSVATALRAEASAGSEIEVLGLRDAAE
jgi:drug/metabolite transporter (DMT)-like permease